MVPETFMRTSTGSQCTRRLPPSSPAYICRGCPGAGVRYAAMEPAFFYAGRSLTNVINFEGYKREKCVVRR
jgi:hypothetical protein